MNLTKRSLVVLVLALLGLIKPVLSVFDVFERFAESWAPAVVTLLVAAVWVSVVVALRFQHPFRDLLVVGALYGFFASGLEELVWRISPEMAPSSLSRIGPVGMLVANAAWGAALGLIASAVNRLLARRKADLFARRFGRSSARQVPLSELWSNRSIRRM